MKEITVDATIENMNTVTAFVDDFLDQIACPMKSKIQINIVIDEIFGNICHYFILYLFFSFFIVIIVNILCVYL